MAFIIRRRANIVTMMRFTFESFRDDLLFDKEMLQRIWVLRNHLADMNPVEAMMFLKDKIKFTKTNEEFLISMNG